MNMGALRVFDTSGTLYPTARDTFPEELNLSCSSRPVNQKFLAVYKGAQCITPLQEQGKTSLHPEAHFVIFSLLLLALQNQKINRSSNSHKQ
jgi:hypothetical protein